MDKLRLLKKFEELSLKVGLEADEVRLYLLLLANGGGQLHGRIGYSTIKGALGKGFTLARLKQACRRLSVHALIDVIPTPMDDTSTEDFTVAYRIVDTAEEQPRKDISSSVTVEGASVLIVDDDRDILTVAASFFKDEGMSVHCAVNGKEALRKLREGIFLLMITDFDMPGMNGIKLAEKAREIAPGMPIIMATCNISPETSSMARAVGIAEVVAKPFDFKKLLTMAKRMIVK